MPRFPQYQIIGVQDKGRGPRDRNPWHLRWRSNAETPWGTVQVYPTFMAAVEARDVAIRAGGSGLSTAHRVDL